MTQIEQVETGNGERRLSIYGLANLFLRERKLMIAIPLVTLITAVVVTLFQPPEFVSKSQIVAEGAQASTPLATLAEQFGVRVSSSGGPLSPDFYAQLLTSPEILMPLASHPYTMTLPDSQKVSGYLAKLYGVKIKPGTRTEDIIQASSDVLAHALVGTADPVTGVITLTVTAPARDLSIKLNRDILTSASDFLQERRQTKAETETKFVESRLEESRAQLAVAEASLRDFVSQNRQYQTSPQLSLQYAQLERSVSLRQQVFLTLSQAYEQARIDAMRNSSLISVLQRPEYAVSRKAARLARNIVLGVILGLLLAMGVVVTRARLAREPIENPADVEEFRALIREAVPKPRRRHRKVQGSG